MSGSALQIPGASFTNFTPKSLTVPDRTGLVAEFLFGQSASLGNAGRAKRNAANPGTPGAISGAGAPVYNAYSTVWSGYATPLGPATGVATLDTGVVISGDCTIVQICKNHYPGLYPTMPTFGSTDAYFGIWPNLINGSGWFFYNSLSGASPAVPSVAVPNDSLFHFACGVGPLQQQASMYVGQSLAAAPKVGGNTGTGTVSNNYSDATSTDGTVTIAFTSATAFSVTHSINGAMPAGVAGTPYSSAGINFTITAGGTAFVAGDGFVLTSGAALLSSVGTAAGGARGTHTLQVGQANSAVVESAYVSAYSRALTQANVLALYQSLRQFYTGKIAMA